MDIASGEICLEVVEGADLSDYYTKEESETLLDGKYDADNPNGYTDDTLAQKAQSTASAASSDAKKAQTAADNAAKTATDYISVTDGTVKIAQNFDAITIGSEESNNIRMDEDSIDFYVANEMLGYINQRKAYFAHLEAHNTLLISDVFAVRKTPGGALGIYLR